MPRPTRSLLAVGERAIYISFIKNYLHQNGGLDTGLLVGRAEVYGATDRCA